MKTKGSVAFSATALQYFGEKLSLALTTLNFLISNPQKYTDHAPNSVPKSLLDSVLQTQKCLTLRSLTDRDSPPGMPTQLMALQTAPSASSQKIFLPYGFVFIFGIAS